MAERITKWEPVSDIDSPFESIVYSFEQDALLVRMIGVRVLTLHFLKVIALHFEQEAPGFDFVKGPLPMLRKSQTFPLLSVHESEWLEKYKMVYGELSHFALISSDHLVQLLAKPKVDVRWEKRDGA